MKVVLINGSPNSNGCTYTALLEVQRGLTENGIDSEIIHIGTEEISGCSGCYACRKLGRCVKNDIVNDIAEKLVEADGMIFSSPVYFSSPNGSMISLLDRLYASSSRRFKYKPCGCIVSARRAGTTASLDALNKYPLINEQPLVASSYWCMVHGTEPEQVRADTEGMRIAYDLGRNMAWLVRALHDMPRPEKD